MAPKSNVKLPNRLRTNRFTWYYAVIYTLTTSIIMTSIMLLDTLRLRGLVALSLPSLLLNLLHNTILSFLLYAYCFHLCRRLHAKPSITYGIVIIGGIVMSFIYTLLSRTIRQLFLGDFDTTELIDISVISDGFVALTIILICILLLNIDRAQKYALEAEKMQTQNMQSHYEALEHQIDPHFLFNSLNTLSGLIAIDDKRSQQYLQHLAATYRYIMQRHQVVSLHQELEFVDSYLSMMQIRYGDCLLIKKDIPPQLLTYSLPSISVQLLVENAIKHNTISNLHPLEIAITACDCDNPTISVINTLQPKQSQTSSHGIGLANLSQRYMLLQHTNILITQDEHYFSVTLPLVLNTIITQ
ncbi:MAG: histidine kinase [Bacteroidales bacterium]|nr:histidine kinase [Candidatus Colimorpha onthohippi]